MKILSQLSILLFCMMVLASCREQSQSYHYYMLHTEALMQAVAACSKVANAETDPHCAEVSRAQNDFEAHVNAERDDPQAYGQKILAAEMALGELKKNVEQIRASSTADKMKLELARRALHQQVLHIKIMLNVVAIMNGEL